MAEAALSPAAAVERLQKLRRLLEGLKVTEEYLRQYPGLAEKLDALMRTASGDRP
jgi:hypothetical protein